jgi:hypothetical protein
VNDRLWRRELSRGPALATAPASGGVPSGAAPPPSAPAVTKEIDGGDNVRLTVVQEEQRQQYEVYRVDLYDSTGTSVRYRRWITSKETGSPHLRDKWVEFTSAQISAAGYTPGPSTTFFVNVVQVGDTDDSPDQLQEI